VIADIAPLAANNRGGRNRHPDAEDPTHGLQSIAAKEQTMTAARDMRPYSRKILIRMLIALLLAAILLLLNYDLLSAIYLSNQLTSIGIIINGGIFALFLAGMIKMAIGLAGYARQEQALADFVDRMDDGADDPAADIDAESIIAHRYRSMQQLFSQHSPINHNAMAAALMARESTRNGTPRFINNVLILGGVFGTIVSLSIALVGASDMLQSAISSSGMGMVIHGMSTALATTITAILCYMMHGFFFNAFGDAQTNLLGRIEEVTAIRLMPKFQIEQKTIDYRITDLLKAMADMIRRIDDGQSGVLGITERLETMLTRVESERSELKTELGDIRQLLRDGFRLPGKDNA